MAKGDGRPAKGSTIEVDPIRDEAAIAFIKHSLSDHPRNYALFVCGINWGLRAGDLTRIQVDKVLDVLPGESFKVRERKTGKVRCLKMSGTTHQAIHSLVKADDLGRDEYLFQRRKGRGPLTVQTVHALVKGWCKAAKLKGNYGSHSLRKTWGYMQRVRGGVAIDLLMRAFGHSSPRITMAYIGIQDHEISDLYDLEI